MGRNRQRWGFRACEGESVPDLQSDCLELSRTAENQLLIWLSWKLGCLTGTASCQPRSSSGKSELAAAWLFVYLSFFEIMLAGNIGAFVAAPIGEHTTKSYRFLLLCECSSDGNKPSVRKMPLSIPPFAPNSVVYRAHFEGSYFMPHFQVIEEWEEECRGSVKLRVLFYRDVVYNYRDKTKALLQQGTKGQGAKVIMFMCRSGISGHVLMTWECDRRSKVSIWNFGEEDTCLLMYHMNHAWSGCWPLVSLLDSLLI